MATQTRILVIEVIMQGELISRVRECLHEHDCPEYVIDNLVRILSIEADTDTVDDFYMCPKCRKVKPSIVKGGFSNSNKQMYRCLNCGRRFVYDYGSMIWHSKKDIDIWFEVFKDILNGHSTYYISERLGIASNTIAYMKDKIVRLLKDCTNMQ